MRSILFPFRHSTLPILARGSLRTPNSERRGWWRARLRNDTIHGAVAVALVAIVPVSSTAEPSTPLSLASAAQRAIAANPRLAAADKEIDIAAGKRIQAGAKPNPELSMELDN